MSITNRGIPKHSGSDSRARRKAALDILREERAQTRKEALAQLQQQYSASLEQLRRRQKIERDAFRNTASEHEMIRYIEEQEQRLARFEQDFKERVRAYDREYDAIEIEARNHELRSEIKQLTTILEQALTQNAAIDLAALRTSFEPYPLFSPPQELAQPLPVPREEDFFGDIHQPNSIQKLLPGVQQRYEQRLAEAEEQYWQAHHAYEQAEQVRQADLEQARNDYMRARAAYEQRKSEVANLPNRYATGDAQAVVTYNAFVLQHSPYPYDFPQRYRVAYSPGPKELIVEYELPLVGIVPEIAEYAADTYKREINEKIRPAQEISEIYAELIAAVCLRTIHELFQADQGQHIQVVVFNGFVYAIDPATGKDVMCHLVSVRATRRQFMEINLARVDKLACLHNLGARFSPDPVRMLPIEPLADIAQHHRLGQDGW